MFGRNKQQRFPEFRRETKKAEPIGSECYYLPPAGYHWKELEAVETEAHTLIAGATGCGKSTLIHSILFNLTAKTPSEARLVLIDLKRGVELCRYESLPHTMKFAESGAEAIEMLDECIELMERRLQEVRAHHDNLYRGADIYIVIDELAFFLQENGKEALTKLQTIGRLGRAARIHLIMATQDPSRGAGGGLPHSLVQNCTYRIGLRCTASIESRQIIGDKGCESLPRHGLALVASCGEINPLPVPMTDEIDINERINYWRPENRNQWLIRRA